MNEVTIGVIGLGVVLALFMTGIEMSFAMIAVGFVGFGYLMSWEAALNLLAKDFFDVFTSYSLTVVPLFILMGQIAFNSGIAKKLFDASYKYVGHIPGGLAISTVAGATAFKAICGSTPATTATFASVAVPEMERYGYDRRLSSGIVATVGTLGILLPPSVTLIIFGIISDQSIGRLFLAGVFPGLIIASFFVIVIYGWCKLNPAVGPKGPTFSWHDRIKVLPEVGWVVVVFLLMVGGIMKGFFTPTEAGSVGTCLVLLLTLFKRDLDFKGYIKSIIESVRTACMVLLLVMSSTILGHFIAVTKIPMLAADWIVSLPFSPVIIVILISLIYLIGGSFIDDLAFMILATPIFFPAIVKLGYNPIWFSMIIAITIMIGVVIPPVAICVFIVKQITKIPMGVIYQGVYPFLISLVVGGILLFFFPQIATWLPATLMGK
ncbi:MAG TPA: TRAP transporter large permease [Syntrophorhabdales bacterium]|nr:TRAP transporter large permease [Syntrophorhabdales bacterium]